MHEIIKPVEKVKMLTLIAVLSNYDMFRVEVSDGTEFYATRIIGTQDYFLKFERQFATSVYAKEEITNIFVNSEVDFICDSLHTTYHIKALHNKENKIMVNERRSYENISDMMNLSFFSDRLNSHNKYIGIILPVDPYCLGELSKQETLQIVNLINIYLGGLSKSMQMCRTIYFQVKKEPNDIKIFVGIFNLEKNIPETSRLLYDNTLKHFISKKTLKNCLKLIEYSENYFT